MLYRSIYFLFNDEQTVKDVADDLERHLDVGDYQLHAIVTKGHQLMELPGVTVQQKSNAAFRTENILWQLSAVVFTIALIALAVSLLAASWFLASMFAVLVVGAQLSGYFFGNRIPNAQLDRFRTGLERGEIVLQIDLPPQHVEKIRSFIAERYPGSPTNISNWNLGTTG